MIKYLFIFVNSITFFLYSLFGGDGGITVTNNIPKNIAPGQEVTIELKVAKGNQSGFAKLQLDLPVGFSVKEIDNKGASFTYVEGIAKWVWSSLPTDEELVVKCFLIAASDANGSKTIGGKYSYVENNAKMVVEMTPVEVMVGVASGSEIVNTNTSTPAANTPTLEGSNATTLIAIEGGTNTTVPVNTNSAAASDTPTIQGYVQPNTNSEPAGNIKVARTITKGADGEFIVNLKIEKGLTKGFARYSDDLPAEVSAKAIKTEGASFSVSDGKLKFVWVSVPDKETLEIAYSLTGLNKDLNLNGEYSYLEQNQSKKFLLPAESISPQVTISNQQNTVAAVSPTQEPVNTNTVIPETPTNTVAVNTNTVSEPDVNAVVTPSETSIKKEGNVNYMVQIGAFTNSAVGKARLSKKFDISEKIISEMAGGYSKFMVGNHSEYKNARDHREKMRNSNRVASAFVVAYNAGKRITVQEALMISNQKWFK